MSPFFSKRAKPNVLATALSAKNIVYKAKTIYLTARNVVCIFRSTVLLYAELSYVKSADSWAVLFLFVGSQARATSQRSHRS